MTTTSDETVYETIKLEHEGPLTWLVFNRPEAANALSETMLSEISHALEWLKTNGGPIIAIRGEGRGFCSGYDIAASGKPRAIDPVVDRDRLQRNLHRWISIWDHPKPVIAAIHGYAIAGGSQLAVYCDITIVADDAKIGEPTVPLGGGFIAPTWAPLVGPKRAKELAFVPGNTIDGPTAVEWGWANHSVPADQLLDSVRSLAERMAMTPPNLLHMKKVAINRSMEAMGIRTAAEGTAEIDALLHMDPSVVALKERIGAEGLKAVISAYRVPSTMDISKKKA